MVLSASPAKPDPATDLQWTKLLAFSDEIQDETWRSAKSSSAIFDSRIYDRGRYSAPQEN
jgi:hypothetical protein